MSDTIAIYCRTSTEDQSERDTIQAQREFLKRHAELYNLEIVEEFLDDGITGTLPLQQRPAGQRLLVGAQQHKFKSVIFYRVDRFSRSLRVLLDAYETLKNVGVNIRSASEPFDTSTPLGVFVMHMLASMSELERATILERTAQGRQRIVKQGRWSGGALPLGYDVNNEGKPILSLRRVPEAQCTEADLARSIFVNIANGRSLVSECQRLQMLNVPSSRRYSNGKVQTRREIEWHPSRLGRMVHNTIYYGHRVFKSTGGHILGEVPALVTKDLWNRAQAQLRKNLHRPKAERVNLLRGLINSTFAAPETVVKPKL